VQGAPVTKQLEVLRAPLLSAPNALGVSEDALVVKSEPKARKKKTGRAPSSTTVTSAQPKPTSETEPIERKTAGGFINPNAVITLPQKFRGLNVSGTATVCNAAMSVDSSLSSHSATSLHGDLPVNCGSEIPHNLPELEESFDLGEIVQLLQLSPATLSLLHTFKL
jgi:hypothetical protein